MKKLRQATLRRRSAFYVLVQANEPDEEFVDPFSQRHDETLLNLLRRPAHPHAAADPDQLELWTPPRTRAAEDAEPRPYQSRRLG